MLALTSNKKITIIASFVWLVLGGGAIFWQITQLNKEFPALSAEAQASPQLNPQKLEQALNYLKEDQLTSSAPSVTLKIDSASQSAQIDEQEGGE